MTATPGSRSCRFGPVIVEYDDRVLVPRPWTLHQSEWAAQVARDAGPGPLLELCSGVGQIGLAAAVHADRDLVQVELDPVAAEFARANAARAGWSERVEVRTRPLSEALQSAERFSVIVADPPYLRSAEIDRWPDDPPLAIDGGEDGLAVVRSCLHVAAGHLGAGGRLLLQVAGPSQAQQIGALLANTPDWGLTVGELRVIDGQRAILLIARPAVMLSVP
jgi:methylase of polypeptide subunit release factors